MSEITPNAIVELSPGVLSQDLPDGEQVLLNLADENYFGLDEVGGRIWAELATGKRVREVVEILSGEFEVERAILEEDTMGLVRQLSEAGLVSVKDA